MCLTDSSRPPLHRDVIVALGAMISVAGAGIVNAPAFAIVAIVLVAMVAAVISPVGLAAASIATLPWFYHPLSLGQAVVPASELLLVAAAVGVGVRTAGSLVLDRPGRRGTLTSLRDTFRSPLVIVALIVTIVGLVLAIWPYDPLHRAESLREWRWTLAEPLILIGVLTLTARRHARLVGLALLAGATLASMQGIGDLITGGGVVVEGTHRIAGPYQHPNSLAIYQARALAFAAAWWALDGRARRWLTPVVVVIGLATVATFSRGAIMAAGVAGLLILWHAPPRVRATGYAAGALGLTGLLIVARERMLDLFSGGSGSLRLAIWDSALRMIADRPIRGYGNDQFLYAYLPRYVNPVAWSERFTAHAHNFILDFWVRLGIIGLAFAILAAIACLRAGWRFTAGSGMGDMVPLAAGVGLVAVVVHGLVDNAYFAHDLAMSAWVLGWLAFGRADPADGEDSANDASSRDRRSWLHRFPSVRGPAQRRS